MELKLNHINVKPFKKTKAELEQLVKANGGSIVQSQSATEDVICVADRNVVKVTSIKKAGKQSIVRPAWLYDCIEQASLPLGVCLQLSRLPLSICLSLGICLPTLRACLPLVCSLPPLVHGQRLARSERDNMGAGVCAWSCRVLRLALRR